MDAQVELLRQFVNICKSNPGILHEPKFAFYREYLERSSLALQIWYHFSFSFFLFSTLKPANKVALLFHDADKNGRDRKF